MRLHHTIPLLLVLAMCGGGCLAGGALWYKAFGPTPVPPKFTPANEPTVVLVENYHNPSITEFDADRIARDVGDDLLKNKVLAMVVDQDQVRALREADPEKFRDMTIPSVGKALGVKQVIYVNLLASTVEGDASNNLVSGRADARVRVVEVETGHTIWPADSQGGYPVGAKVPYAQAEKNTATDMHNALLISLSEQIGRLFHKWKPETEMGGEDLEG